MEFTGRVKKLLPKRSGKSQRTGNDWEVLPFIFEYFEEDNKRFADSVVLETFDTNAMKLLQEGMEIKVVFSHKAREYNGNFYNELRIYNLEFLDKTQQEAAQAATDAAAGQQTTAQPNAPQEGEKGDDLPF